MTAAVYSFCMVFGLAFLVKGADWITAAGVGLGQRLRVPEFVIGATVISIATTLPEFSVSTMAAYQGQVDMAVGNAVGSCLFNIGIILGATAFVAPIPISSSSLRRAASLFLQIGIVVTLICLRLASLNRAVGVLLIVIAAAYLFLSISTRKKEISEIESAPELSGNAIALRFIFGALGIGAGSALVIYCATQIAALFHVPQMIIALTLVAGGTSLPELVVSLTGLMRNRRSLSVGNILGANILDITWVLGSSAVIRDLPIQTRTRYLDLPAMLAMAVLVLVFGANNRQLGRVAGAVLIVAYCVYLALTFRLRFPEVIHV